MIRLLSLIVATTLINAQSGCCDTSRTHCSTNETLCSLEEPVRTNVTCCDFITMKCLPTDIICGVNLMTMNGTTTQCCPPQMTCYTPMPVCPDCCDPTLYLCHTNATLCPPKQAPSMSASPRPYPCCRTNCSASDLVCGVRLWTVNDTLFECCPLNMSCYKPMPICPLCCDPTIFRCPTEMPFCENLSQNNTEKPSTQQNVTCCNPMSENCPRESLACGIRVMTVNDTLFECCPHEVACYKPMAICPDCCDPRIFKCPANAPICTRPNTGDDGCCDNASGSCTPETPICSLKLPLMNNSWYECCPPLPPRMNFTCYKTLPTCPTCCDPTLMRCPTTAPVCSPSSQPSIDAGPSRIPPSQLPISIPSPLSTQSAPPSQSVLPSRLPRPSAPSATALPTQRPTLLPIATKYLRVIISSAPSRSALPPHFTPPSVYLPVLNSAIRIAGANQSMAVSPSNLQRTQANLACAIGVPQQNIQIRNITILYSNGTRYGLPFDPAITQLNSGSDVVCPIPPTRSNTTPVRRLGEVTYSIEITYDIVDPPLVVLSMDGATFMASLENTTAMADLVLALEGAGMSVEAPPELVLTSAFTAASTSSVPVSVESPSTNTSTGPLLYGMIGAIIGAIVVLGVGVGFVIIRLQSRTPITPQQKTETKIVYVMENPLQQPSIESDLHFKNNFNPMGVRR